MLLFNKYKAQATFHNAKLFHVLLVATWGKLSNSLGCTLNMKSLS